MIRVVVVVFTVVTMIRVVRTDMREEKKGPGLNLDHGVIALHDQGPNMSDLMPHHQAKIGGAARPVTVIVNLATTATIKKMIDRIHIHHHQRKVQLLLEIVGEIYLQFQLVHTRPSPTCPRNTVCVHVRDHLHHGARTVTTATARRGGDRVRVVRQVVAGQDRGQEAKVVATMRIAAMTAKIIMAAIGRRPQMNTMMMSLHNLLDRVVGIVPGLMMLVMEILHRDPVQEILLRTEVKGLLTEAIIDHRRYIISNNYLFLVENNLKQTCGQDNFCCTIPIPYSFNSLQ